MANEELKTEYGAGVLVDAEQQYLPNFFETRNYLYQVRNEKRHIELLEQRITLRQHDPDGSEFPDTDELEREFQESKERLNDAMIAVTDLASRLPEIDQQMVITKRYVDLESWEQIASDMDCTVRTVQKLHGKALPVLEEIILKNDPAELN